MIGRSASDWSTFALSTNNNGHGFKVKPPYAYNKCVGHILKHYASHHMPNTLCPSRAGTT